MISTVSPIFLLQSKYCVHPQHIYVAHTKQYIWSSHYRNLHLLVHMWMFIVRTSRSHSHWHTAITYMQNNPGLFVALTDDSRWISLGDPSNTRPACAFREAMEFWRRDYCADWPFESDRAETIVHRTQCIHVNHMCAMQARCISNRCECIGCHPYLHGSIDPRMDWNYQVIGEHILSRLKWWEILHHY